MSRTVYLKILAARARRWAYLLAIGGWRGECAIDLYTDDGRELGALASAAAGDKNWRLWWVSPTACSLRAQARRRQP